MFAVLQYEQIADVQITKSEERHFLRGDLDAETKGLFTD